MGLCSKCYKEAQCVEQKKAHEASPPAATPAAPSPAPAEPAAAGAVEPALEAPAQSPAAPVAVAAPAVPEPAASPAPPEKPAQANRSRCFCCNKKVGLLGFECRCGYVYCSGHRHAGDHACDFDYAAFDRERLAKANPVVAASKLDKF